MTPNATAPPTSQDRAVQDLVFVGFNRRVIALDRFTGEQIWAWKSPQGTGFVTLLLDGDRLLVAVNGYVFCLDPRYGQEVWSNPLKGLGTGITSLASVRGGTPAGGGAAAIAEQQRQEAAAASAAT